jgi:hypothetical protein
MLRRSGLVRDCLIVCRRDAKAASPLDVDVDVSGLPDVSAAELSLQTFERWPESEARHTDGTYRHWLRLWSINCLL